jgi:hypothetical protein
MWGGDGWPPGTEFVGDRFADTGGATGDDDDCILEVFHALSP